MKTAFSKQVADVIASSDILLEILDARFIEKTRNAEIEDAAKALGKEIIYIFNKSDLVDVNLAMRSAAVKKLNPHLFFSSKSRRGAAILRRFIQIEAKRTGKPEVYIGVIGYPNTGKSSMINFLSRRKSAQISSDAGTTKGLQRVKIFPEVYLIDTPGIIPQDEKISKDREMTIKNAQIGATTWNRAKNPEMVVDSLMKENPGILERHYGIESGGDSEVLIENLGRKSRFLIKGNLVDENRTAKKILRDWQEGKIRSSIFSHIK